jgi:hypothetical protein
MNVIDWPPYFALSALAFGTGGAPIALAEVARVVPAEAMLSEATRASTMTDPVPKINRRRFMSITSFLAQTPKAPEHGNGQLVHADPINQPKLGSPPSGL